LIPWPKKGKRFSLYFALAAICATSDVHAQSNENDRLVFNHGRALLIGISKYENGAWPDLRDVTQDIALLQKGLGPHFARIDVLPNPKTSEIRKALEALAQDKTLDRIFVYYSGHGFTDYKHNFVGYITGSDTPSQEANPDKAVQGAIGMQAIDNILESASAVQIMVAFDSCFSGTIFESKIFTTPPLKIQEDEIIKNLLRRPVISYITAGKENQPIPENSLFARVLISAISGRADYWGNGFVTGPDIGVYAYNEIYRVTAGRNTPIVGNSRSEDRKHSEFVFAVPGGVRKPVRIAGSMGFFDWDRYNFNPETMQKIQQAAEMYRGRPQSVKVQITGFTDRGGRTFDQNVELSNREANAAAAALERLGVTRDDLVVNARGDKYQRIGLDNAPSDRRVEIVVP
jgi:outer membrane protein OmpA-like peptidoglycan-associated protein